MKARVLIKTLSAAEADTTHGHHRRRHAGIWIRPLALLLQLAACDYKHVAATGLIKQNGFKKSRAQVTWTLPLFAFHLMHVQHINLPTWFLPT